MNADEWAEENGNPMLDKGATVDKPDAGSFKVIETDNMTGWDQYLNNMRTSPWSGTFTREEAEASVKWREEHISRRYAYEIVPAEPWMDDNDATRQRHDERQGRHGSRGMEDCGNIDCREASMRLSRDAINRSFAAADVAKAASVGDGDGTGPVATDLFAHPGVTAPELPIAEPAEVHDCLQAAVVVSGDRKTWYPCRSHEGGVHHFAATWPACPAPWCRLPYSHHLEGTMHDVPSGTVEYHDAIGAVS